jgi:hypothetical protein
VTGDGEMVEHDVFSEGSMQHVVSRDFIYKRAVADDSEGNWRTSA